MGKFLESKGALMELLMTNLKKTLIIGAIATAFAAIPAVTAQVTEAVKDQAVDAVKDAATDAAKDAAKDQALKTVKGTGYGSGAVEAAEKVEGAADKAKSYGLSLIHI